MMEFTKLEEAMSHRYGVWAGFPRGHKYDPSRCAEEVSSGGGGLTFHRCNRPNGFGPNSLYCKQHDPAAIEAKHITREAKYKAQNIAERPKWSGHQLLALLIESQRSTGGDWRERRDKLIAYCQGAESTRD